MEAKRIYDKYLNLTGNDALKAALYLSNDMLEGSSKMNGLSLIACEEALNALVREAMVRRNKKVGAR